MNDFEKAIDEIHMFLNEHYGTFIDYLAKEHKLSDEKAEEKAEKMLKEIENYSF